MDWRVEGQWVLWMTERGSLCWIPKWNSVLFVFGITCWVFFLWKRHVTLSPLFPNNQILLFLFWILLLWLCAVNSCVLRHYVSRLCVCLSEHLSVRPSLSFLWKWSLSYAWNKFLFCFNNELILIWQSKVMFTLTSQNTYASQIHRDIITFCKKNVVVMIQHHNPRPTEALWSYYNWSETELVKLFLGFHLKQCWL